MTQVRPPVQNRLLGPQEPPQAPWGGGASPGTGVRGGCERLPGRRFRASPDTPAPCKQIPLLPDAPLSCMSQISPSRFLAWIKDRLQQRTTLQAGSTIEVSQVSWGTPFGPGAGVKWERGRGGRSPGAWEGWTEHLKSRPRCPRPEVSPPQAGERPFPTRGVASG